MKGNEAEGICILNKIFTDVASNREFDDCNLRIWSHMVGKRIYDDVSIGYNFSTTSDSLIEHSMDVGIVSGKIAVMIGWNIESVIHMLYSATLHDIGKLEIPKEILYKPAILDEDEMDIVKMHAIKGNNLLVLNKIPSSTCDCALYHHERVNGSGYPFSLRGYMIPIMCRIVAVADVFCALTEKRVYKDTISVTKALEFIESNADPLFSKSVVRALLKIYRPANSELLKVHNG